tara:strand:+ start:199 stop:507 length:309 start_codon:yes stop_codon:yes gene_type:complete
MAHYAFLDKNNTVTEVITGIDETELIEGLNPETWYGNFRGQKCVRTSYSASIRYNYAAIGYSYDAKADAFIPPKVECGHSELTLDKTIYQWSCTNEEHNFVS